MIVTVKTVKYSEPFKLNVEPTTTVLQLKARLSSDHGAPVDGQELIYAGKLLKDRETLEFMEGVENIYLVCIIFKIRISEDGDDMGRCADLGDLGNYAEFDSAQRTNCWAQHSPRIALGCQNSLATVYGSFGFAAVFGNDELTKDVNYMEVKLGGQQGSVYVGVVCADLANGSSLSIAKGRILGVGLERKVWLMNANVGSLYGNGKSGSDKAGGFVEGDSVGVLVDFNDGSLSFFKNGVKHGPGYPAGSVTGPVVLAMQMSNTGSSGSVIAGALAPGVQKEVCLHHTTHRSGFYLATHQFSHTLGP
jgi:hypothetical protein